MDFVTRFPRASWKHDTMWVIVDQLTKSAHFLAVQMTFTLEESTGYTYERSSSLYHIRPGSKVYGSLLEEFPESHRNTVVDEHCISSTDRWPVRDNHIGFRGHATSMLPISQGWLRRAFSLARVHL